MPISTKCLQMGAGVNGDLGQMDIWGKWVPKCPKRVYYKCPNIPVPISPKCLQMGSGANGHVEKMDIWRKGAPQVPKRGIPSALCPLPRNVYIWALGQMGTWGKWTLGEGVPQVSCTHPPVFSNRHLGLQVLIYPSAHFALVSIWEKWAQLR